MSDAPAKVEPGDIGEGVMFTAGGAPCCTLGWWSHWEGRDGDACGSFNAAHERGDPFAVALVNEAEKIHGCPEREPADNVVEANDNHLTDEGRAEMWNAAVDVVRGQG